MSRRHGMAGFTLVELLLAMTLLSMLLALAYGGLHAATRATDRGQTVLEDSSRIRMAHQFLHRQFSQLLPLAFDQNEDGSERTVFVGEPLRVRYVAPMPGYLGFGGPQVQELSIIQGDDGLKLVLTHALLQEFEEERLDDRDPIPLLESIESAQFSYLGEDEESELLRWTSLWVNPTVLPRSVSLEVQFNDDVYIRWPLLTAAVRIDGSALLELAPDAFGVENFNTSIRDLIDRRAKKE